MGYLLLMIDVNHVLIIIFLFMVFGIDLFGYICRLVLIEGWILDKHGHGIGWGGFFGGPQYPHDTGVSSK